MASKTKKPTKYHYYMDFKRGNYFEITQGLGDQYPGLLSGSGIGIGGIDVHFYCTAKKFKTIKEFTQRNYPKFKVTRYTHKEYLGQE